MTQRTTPLGTPLGAQEHALLRSIASGAAAATLSSTQRLRFELLGLIEDRADGLRLTARGRALASVAPGAAAGSASGQPDVRPSDPPRDRRGRRLGLRRRSPF